MSPTKTSERTYSVMCTCGHEMRVRKKHIGRMCRCTKCSHPIYVTPNLISPPLEARQIESLRYFEEDEVPVFWRKGDLLMEVYEVRETLGHGGMGVVYRVRHRGWDIDIAVKTPRSRHVPKQHLMDDFERECETWVNLSPHPNVVTCYYVRRLGGIPRVFAEYVEGASLRELVGTKRLYEGAPDEVLLHMLDIGIQFARGLEHAHLEGLAHQDVKPGNLMVGDDGVAKVTDFGMAKSLVGLDEDSEDGDEAPKKKKRTGTPLYRSPDKNMEGIAAQKSDLWSWGVSMVEMFCGDVFWLEGNEMPGAFQNFLEGSDWDESVPRIPQKLTDLILQCFRLDPEERPRDLGAAADSMTIIYEEVSGSDYPREKPAQVSITADILNNRAVSLVDLGRGKEAEILWESAGEASPGHLESRYNRNLRHWRTGRLTDVDFLYMFDDDPPPGTPDWVPRYLKARVLLERGDHIPARNLLQQLYKEEKNRRDVSFALSIAQNSVEFDKRLDNEITLPAELTAVDVSEEGAWIAAGLSNGAIRLIDTDTGRVVTKLEGHSDRVCTVKFSRDGSRLLSAGVDGRLKLWTTVEGRCLRDMEGHGNSHCAAVLSGDGLTALSGGEDGTLRLWDTKKGKYVRRLWGHEGAVHTVSLSACGQWAVSGGNDKTIRLWSTESGDCEKIFEGNHRSITSVHLNMDESVVVSASGRKIKAWDLESGEETKNFRAHKSKVRGLCVTDNFSHALSATAKDTLKLWNLRTGQCMRSFEGHSPVALSGDGETAASAGRHKKLLIWMLNLSFVSLSAPYMICRHDDSPPV